MTGEGRLLGRMNLLVRLGNQPCVRLLQDLSYMKLRERKKLFCPVPGSD